ncbi:hypothetical protein D3C77_418320 [compost metagenome]
MYLEPYLADEYAFPSPPDSQSRHKIADPVPHQAKALDDPSPLHTIRKPTAIRIYQMYLVASTHQIRRLSPLMNLPSAQYALDQEGSDIRYLSKA